MRIVITGSSSGIGFALASYLLVAGHEVWGLARADQSALPLAESTRFHHTCCDITDWSQVDAAARVIASVWSTIDALVTAAGMQGAVGRTVEMDPALWAATVRTNLDGTFHAIRAFHPLLARAPRRAKIVCFSGGGATKARTNFSAYGAAKTAIVRLVETVAEEERDRALDINAIAPGAIATRMTDEVIALGAERVGTTEFKAAQKQKAAGAEPMRKAVALVEWLLSPASDGITGRLISAPWDPWPSLDRHAAELADSDIYTLRRIVPEDRGTKW